MGERLPNSSKDTSPAAQSTKTRAQLQRAPLPACDWRLHTGSPRSDRPCTPAANIKVSAMSAVNSGYSHVCWLEQGQAGSWPAGKLPPHPCTAFADLGRWPHVQPGIEGSPRSTRGGVHTVWCGWKQLRIAGVRWEPASQKCVGWRRLGAAVLSFVGSQGGQRAHRCSGHAGKGSQFAVEQGGGKGWPKF